ncbi:MAG: triphosphoribosyl-dephospho-CoA synthase [Hyphomicrobium sp.]
MLKTNFPVSQDLIQLCYVEACRLEVRTLKPGNVHIFLEGHGMTVADFDRSAEITAAFISDPALSVGTRIWNSIEATINALQTNTNLGIILLCAPIAAAVGPMGSGDSLKKRIAHILASLTHEDACKAYKAIAKAKPAGLGNVLDGDVTKAPPSEWTLWDAMKESSPYDLIAAQYACFFSDIMQNAGLYKKYVNEGASPKESLSFLFLQILSQIHDTHIVRKHGQESAECVRKKASEVLTELAVSKAQDLSAPRCHERLLAFDKELKTAGYNPGSLADMMCASVFYSFLSNLHS